MEGFNGRTNGSGPVPTHDQSKEFKNIIVPSFVIVHGGIYSNDCNKLKHAP